MSIISPSSPSQIEGATEPLAANSGANGSVKFREGTTVKLQFPSEIRKVEYAPASKPERIVAPETSVVIEKGPMLETPSL